MEKPILPESPPKPVIPAEPISKEQQLADLREKAVAIKTCMKLSMEEVEALILGGKVVKGKIFMEYFWKNVIIG